MSSSGQDRIMSFPGPRFGPVTVSTCSQEIRPGIAEKKLERGPVDFI